MDFVKKQLWNFYKTLAALLFIGNNAFVWMLPEIVV